MDTTSIIAVGKDQCSSVRFLPCLRRPPLSPQRDDDLALGGAILQRGDRLGGALERIHLRLRRRHRARRQQRLQLGPLLGADSRGGVTVQAPQPTPTASTLLSSSRFTLTVGISPPVNPITSSRPPGASERSESVNRSPPTGSTTMSTPRPSVSSFTASLKPSASTTSVAPAAWATSALSSLLTTAIVRDAPERGRQPQRRGADTARGAVHEHRLARRAAGRGCAARSASSGR